MLVHALTKFQVTVRPRVEIGGERSLERVGLGDVVHRLLVSGVVTVNDVSGNVVIASTSVDPQFPKRDGEFRRVLVREV